MKTQIIKKSGYTWLATILILVFLFAGCGGNNPAQSEEPAEEILPVEEPTEEVIPTEEPTAEATPTEEIAPTEEPTEEVIPTVIPTESVFYLPPIMGKYSVSGLDPDFNNYEGELEITASNGFYLWNWLDREREGVGVDQENVVSVAWLNRDLESSTADCTPISFMIQEDGALLGFFVEEWRGKQFGSAQAWPDGEMGEGIEGTYRFGGQYHTTNASISAPLEITRDGDLYKFYWEFWSFEWFGVGIQRDNIVSVAISRRGDKNCMLVSYLIEEDGTLDGVWAYLDGSELGTDVAVPETSE